MRLDPQLSPAEFPLSVENTRQVLARTLDMGRIHTTEHFKQRGRERGFTTIDAERVIRYGDVIGEPEYCPRFRNWRFLLSGVSCGRVLEICVGLTLDLDLEFPVIALITGIPMRRRSKCIAKKPVPTRRL